MMLHNAMFIPTLLTDTYRCHWGRAPPEKATNSGITLTCLSQCTPGEPCNPRRIILNTLRNGLGPRPPSFLAFIPTSKVWFSRSLGNAFSRERGAPPSPAAWAFECSNWFVQYPGSCRLLEKKDEQWHFRLGRTRQGNDVQILRAKMICRVRYVSRESLLSSAGEKPLARGKV